MLVTPIVALWLVWSIGDGQALNVTYLDLKLTITESDALARWFGSAFAIVSFASALFALHQKSRLELCAAQMCAGAALGVVFAGDFITLFVFWEIMALASTFLIWSAGTAAVAPGMRYLLIHVLGGALLLSGIAGEFQATGSIAFSAMQPDSVARWLIFIGFLVNAAAPPLSVWLPDAYPKSSYSGMVV
ncbi:MAG TPA: proton-conducting transporter membrane subunit, partial [Burkholderiaceae bacterium]|nr:proton-conducting transporter membrane subunit [Burkholderiaceae bacterium]